MKISRDPRINLIDSTNLQINDIQPLDAGDYVCQISTLIPTEQIHTLEILGSCLYDLIYALLNKEKSYEVLVLSDSANVATSSA